MPFAQINYQQKVGNSNLTIDEIGCLVTSDCNLLESVGKAIDPAALNTFYTNNNVYTYDATDHANDDLSWGSITRYDPDLVVDHTGGAGWPDSSLSIVKFYYRAHSGYMTTHFCKVADAGNHVIIDSWDGKVKTPAEYESYYGNPVAWAVYRVNIPAPAVEVVPAPVPKTSNIVYAKLDTPLDLVTNRQPTHWWALNFVNDTQAVSVAELNQGTPFRAYGRAQRTDGDKPTYFMTQEDFGNADISGIPNNNNGVNTIDLSPAPAPQATVATPSTPSASNGEDVGEKINVTINPTDWHTTYTAFLSPQEYVANANVLVTDIDEENHPAGLPAQQQLIKGQDVKVAGTFARDGFKYFRTVKSVDDGVWYGIPVISLTKLADISEETLSKISGNLKNEEITVSHDKTIAAAAGANGFLKRLLHIK